MEFLKTHFSTIIISLVAPLIAYFLAFEIEFTKIETRQVSTDALIKVQNEQIQTFVPRSEHQQVYEWQKKYEVQIDNRLNRLENKIDQSNQQISGVLKILIETKK